jgi:hypothetical protein
MTKCIIIISLLLTSCGLIKIVETNPKPNLKSIHMWDYHRGYTLEGYHSHPDYDCTIEK